MSQQNSTLSWCCDICGKDFADKRALRRHIGSVHEIKVFKIWLGKIAAASMFAELDIFLNGKVEKILKGSMDSILSPSLGIVNKLLVFKSFLTTSINVFTFPTHYLNSYWMWRWWDQIQAIFLNLFLLYTLHHILYSGFVILVLVVNQI